MSHTSWDNHDYTLWRRNGNKSSNHTLIFTWKNSYKLLWLSFRSTYISLTSSTCVYISFTEIIISRDREKKKKHVAGSSSCLLLPVILATTVLYRWKSATLEFDTSYIRVLMDDQWFIFLQHHTFPSGCFIPIINTNIYTSLHIHESSYIGTIHLNKVSFVGKYKERRKNFHIDRCNCGPLSNVYTLYGFWWIIHDRLKQNKYLVQSHIILKYNLWKKRGEKIIIKKRVSLEAFD